MKYEQRWDLFWARLIRILQVQIELQKWFVSLKNRGDSFHAIAVVQDKAESVLIDGNAIPASFKYKVRVIFGFETLSASLNGFIDCE